MLQLLLSMENVVFVALTGNMVAISVGMLQLLLLTINIYFCCYYWQVLAASSSLNGASERLYE